MSLISRKYDEVHEGLRVPRIFPAESPDPYFFGDSEEAVEIGNNRKKPILARKHPSRRKSTGPGIQQEIFLEHEDLHVPRRTFLILTTLSSCSLLDIEPVNQAWFFIILWQRLHLDYGCC